MQLELSSKAAQVRHFVLHKRALLLVFLFAAALGIRLYRIDEPPLDFHATRQYRSLLIARAFYYERSTSIPEWKKQVARINYQRQGTLEPPVMELLASAGYHLIGGERYWIPKALSALFWLAGGGFLYRIAKKMVDENAALFSTAIYLFLPFAVTASRSFQPDPLMIMLLLASVYGMLWYDDRPSPHRLASAAVVSAVTIFIKPVSLFVIYSTFLALTVIRLVSGAKHSESPGSLGPCARFDPLERPQGARLLSFAPKTRLGVRRSVTSSSLFVFFLVTLLPAVIFYLYGIFIAGFLKVQAQSSFLPQLLLTPFFWRGWLHNIRLVVGFTVLIGALFGILFVRPGRSRCLLLGMWAGYALFCLVFNYHIATHDYYHLQLVPIVALSLGPVISFGFNRVLEINQAWYGRMAVWSIVLIAFILLSIEARPRPLNRTLETKLGVAEEIGEQINHDANTVYLSSDYGLSLEYHGELSGLPWPLVSDLEWERLAGMEVLDAGERFQAWFAHAAPSYFIVLDLREYEQQPDLKSYLSDHYPIFVQNEDYLIFDLGQKQ